MQTFQKKNLIYFKIQQKVQLSWDTKKKLNYGKKLLAKTKPDCDYEKHEEKNLTIPNLT